jgi:hypothetical protein
VSFAHVNGTDLPDGPWDAIVVVDVLYLLEAMERQGLVRHAAAMLSSGGRFVVKETDLEPVWKFRASLIQERIAVKVLRLTKGGEVAFTPPATIKSWMQSAGLEVTEQSLARRRIHPHHLIVGTNPLG